MKKVRPLGTWYNGITENVIYAFWVLHMPCNQHRYCVVPVKPVKPVISLIPFLHPQLLLGVSLFTPCKSATSATSVTNTPLQDFCTLVQHFSTSKHNTSLDDETIKAELDQSDLANLITTTPTDRREWAELLANRLNNNQAQS